MSVSRIRLHLHNFCLSRQNLLPEQAQPSSVEKVPSSVEQLPNNTYTIYVDASFDHITNSSGTGMVLISNAGTREGVKGSDAYGVIDSEASECITILEALS